MRLIDDTRHVAAEPTSRAYDEGAAEEKLVACSRDRFVRHAEPLLRGA